MLWRLLGTSALVLLGAAPALGQEVFPARPVTMLTTFAVGGITDIISRSTAAGMSDTLGQPVVVENRPGGNGAVGLGAVIRAKPDGHTLALTVSSVITLNPLINKDVSYDALRDLVPIGNIGNSGLLITANPSLPARNMAEYIALAKAGPGKISLGIVSAAGKLLQAMLDQSTGAQLLQVPFGGTAPALTAMLGGNIDSMLDTAGGARGQVEAGKVRALAVTGLQRSRLLPNVPTVAETVPGFEVATWFGLFAPAGTPPDRVAILNRALARALEQPKTRDALTAVDVAPVGNSPQEFESKIRAELERNRQIVQKYNITN
jgi:tripartite-type tricarboxylate transporter receptor subunit TctC